MEASRLSAVDTVDAGLSTFIHARSRMLAAATRTLGSDAEAEDLLQDVWLRWQHADRVAVRNAAAFLTTTTIHLAINRRTAARCRHERPLEAWPGEPATLELGPALLAERGQALEAALLQLLATLPPIERAAYLLREAFDYGYLRIAELIGLSEANSRQLVTRARKRLARGHRRLVSVTELQRLATAFIEAARSGDVLKLEAMLAADIARWRASRALVTQPLHGASAATGEGSRHLAIAERSSLQRHRVV